MGPIDVDAKTGVLVGGWERHPELAADAISAGDLEPYEGYTYAVAPLQ